MDELEVKSLTVQGEVLTSNGLLVCALKYEDTKNILGSLDFTGDYQAFEYFEVQKQIRIDGNFVRASVVFKDRILSSLLLKFDDNEYDDRTSELSKLKLESLIQKLTQNQGQKIKGRKYFQRFQGAQIDLSGTTSKRPMIVIRFEDIGNSD